MIGSKVIWTNLKLFLIVNITNGVSLLIGWGIGSLFGDKQWFVGAMIGGLLGIFGAVYFAERLGLFERTAFNAVARFSMCGLAIASIIASVNKGSYLVQVASFLLTGVGALVGKWSDRLFYRSDDPPPSII